MLTKSREELCCLASHLDERRELILQRWRTATESAPGAVVAMFLTRVQFNNHMPAVLDSLSAQLRAGGQLGGAGNEAEGMEHGRQRWQQGYSLRELTCEWTWLNLCLVEELEGYAAAHVGLEADVMPVARRLVAEACGDGVTASTTQYWRLHQTATAGQVHDLNRALATVERVAQARAQAWREAAHDLRGSVTVVELAAHVIRSDDGHEGLRTLGLDTLQRGVASLHVMLSELISLAKLETGEEKRQVGTFDAGEMLTDFCLSARPLAAKSGLWLKTEGPECLMVEGDERKVERILQNLLLNALKYTRHGGVTVIWGQVDGANPGCWSFCVQDTGPGLASKFAAPLAHKLSEDGGAENAPAAAAPSALFPESETPGEGVGLAIVKRLCELLDATLKLETSPGQGSTFRVSFPLAYE